MLWLIFAFLASMTFAVVHVLDSYCVEDIYQKPWMGMVVSSFTSLTVFLSIPFILPLMPPLSATWQLIGAGILSGVLIQINQALYFEALDHSDASMVTAYWNMIPAFMPIASYLLLGEVLNSYQYTGITLLVSLSIALSLLDGNYLTERIAFLLIFIASILQVIAILLMDYLFGEIPFYYAFLIFTTGLVITGFFPLLFSDIRKVTNENFVHLSTHMKLFLYLEILNLLAYAFLQGSLKHGLPSLVSAFEAITPANTLIAALVISKIYKVKIKSKIFKNIPVKLVVIACMTFGVILVS